MTPTEKSRQRKDQVVLALAVLAYTAATIMIQIWWGLSGTVMAVALTAVVTVINIASARLSNLTKDENKAPEVEA